MLKTMLPQLSTPDLTNLYANASRLSVTAGPQQAAALELMPALESELGGRRAPEPERATKRAPRSRRQIAGKSAAGVP
jgi:hypothetical protein